jgi:acetyltransferase-like isoleucine patch superfamily enzyme
MKYGKDFTTGYHCRIDMIGENNNIKLEIGDNCVIGDYCQLSASNKISIGNNASALGWKLSEGQIEI